MMKQASASFFPPIALDNDAPMYRQLYDWFRTAILEGQLKPGRRVPSTRSLAAELKVSRITVLSAFEQLYAEGYLETSVGSGTYVSRSIPDDLVTLRRTAPRERMPRSGIAFDKRRSRSVRLADPRDPAHEDGQQPARHISQRGSLRKISRFGMALASALPEPWSNRLGPFSVSMPALDHFPFAVWSRLVIRHSRQPAKEMLAYSDPMGHPPFREAIAEYVGTVRGVRCDPSQVMVVTGSQQALEISARVLLDPRNAVWIEEPSYPGARQVFVRSEIRLIPVPVDSQGLDVKEGVRRCRDARAAYITPSHQYPLGMTMSASRRMLLLNWAARQSSWIIEDDYDSEYRFSSRPIAAVQGLDVNARVIYIGTFSKVLFPSLRVGYLIVPKDLIRPFSRARENFDLFSSTLYQAVLTDFIREGHLGRHIRRMRTLYAERRDALTEEIRQQIGTTIEIVVAKAGIHLVIRLPAGVDDVNVSQRAFREGVAVMPLSICYQKKPRRGGLILGYGGTDRQQIREGIRKLASVLKQISRSK
jgi:GntR family transcriptional regulator / MocR family aminotransferase